MASGCDVGGRFDTSSRTSARYRSSSASACPEALNIANTTTMTPIQTAAMMSAIVTKSIGRDFPPARSSAARDINPRIGRGPCGSYLHNFASRDVTRQPSDPTGSRWGLTRDGPHTARSQSPTDAAPRPTARRENALTRRPEAADHIAAAGAGAYEVRDLPDQFIADHVALAVVDRLRPRTSSAATSVRDGRAGRRGRVLAQPPR
jgi:hypothetical protein